MQICSTQKKGASVVVGAALLTTLLGGCKSDPAAEESGVPKGTTVTNATPAPVGTLPPMTPEQRAMYDKIQQEKAAGMKPR
jgi:hypothetical protein